MKVIWEEKDVRAGTIVGTSDSRERFLIAYIINTGNRYALVSLADGLIMKPEGVSAAAFAEQLTQLCLIPADFLTTKFGGESK